MQNSEHIKSIIIVQKRRFLAVNVLSNPHRFGSARFHTIPLTILNLGKFIVKYFINLSVGYIGAEEFD